MHKNQYVALMEIATDRNRENDRRIRYVQISDDVLLELLQSVDVRTVEGWVPGLWEK